MLTVNESSIPSTQFRWMRTVDESMEAMVGAIHEAKKSIRLEMYIYTASPIGEHFRDALVKAAQRGLEVRVLIDSWGSVTLSDKFWDPLRAAGGQVRWFNPLSWYRGGIRNHRKLLVCDETIAFVGGFNISTEYQGDGINRGWYDLGLQVEGGLARDLGGSFDALYQLADFRQRRFPGFFAQAVDHKILVRPEGQIILAGPGHNPRFLKSVLLKDLRRARTIRIIAAYFLPLRPIRRALVRAARSGCRVQLVLAGKSDVPLLQMACRRFYQTFLRAGVEIYEYQPQILHAKLIVTDEATYVGSANLDRRSFLSNYELLLRVTTSDIREQAEEIFHNALRHCRQVEAATWRTSRTFWSKLKERWAFFFLARVDPFLSRRQLQSLH